METVRTDTSVDVAIVGYGPTGQLLALLLGQLGHRVAVVDRWPHLYPLPRAVHFNHEIARIFQSAGLADDVMPIADRIDQYEWRNEKNDLLLQLDWSGIGQSGWPVASMFAQPELERLLDRHVKAIPSVTVYQGWEARALSHAENSVELQIERGELQAGQWVGTGETRSIVARWVIGADGANSFVRRALDIAWQDLGFAFDWLVIDVKPHCTREWVPNMWQLCDPRRPATLIPGGPGRRRWEFMLLPGERADDMNRAEVAWQLLAPWDITPANAELERNAVYTFRAQWATNWRRGRAFLAGDAAHLMPPFAGQGMCSGMRDSMALAWRLDAVLRGGMPEKVLESYGPERSGHVQELIDFSIELGKVVCITDREAANGRDKAMLAARARPGYAAPPPPAPSLGPGLWMPGAPGAGKLGVQAEVELDGTRGLFDDVVGKGFALIAREADVLATVSPENRDALHAQGAALVHIGPGGMIDVNGRYRSWLDELGCVAALVRPDFYVYGGARTRSEIDGLLDAWRDSLGLRPYAATGEEIRMNPSRRHDRLGVHSIGAFRMTVPSLVQAEKFYSAFGLRVERDPRGLTLRTHCSDHVWGRVCEGTKKKLDGLSFHCFEDDADELYRHILSRGVERIASPAPDDTTGLWFRDPDGLALQVKPGPKTTINGSQHRSPQLPSDGKRCAPYSGQARPALPQRLSHIARMTSSVPAQLDFYTRVLGLRLSDRSGDAVAFLHAPHGSDHHLVAFMGSTGPALHHLSWDVPTVEDVGLGMRRMHAAGYTTGWGVGRHVLGSNYFYYAQDPWGSWCEFSATMDYIPAEVEWEGLDHPADDSVYLWGPPVVNRPDFVGDRRVWRYAARAECTRFRL